jgi:hypothetical protein
MTDQAEDAAALTLMVLFATPLAVPQGFRGQGEGQTGLVTTDNRSMAGSDEVIARDAVIIP